eukprot:TRINITY_DN5200_c0_g1_i1.p1 TRINITY_DN5200_c0_g1~~TRINITY_DN5200_c0_g1_i1.p1  ORF type:complete len:192 (-),score=22.22 TRINITY_DN5200_c0_g1_i1:31-606(-)
MAEDTPLITKLPTNHFGDIMSSTETTLRLPDQFSRMERVVLTANGNLQRILSAYYNDTVTIKVLKNKNISSDQTIDTLFEREVNLVCQEKVLCVATSEIKISDSSILDLVVNQGVGLGQLFRYLDKLPSFHLEAIGYKGDTFWRTYTLRIVGVECRITEVFPHDMFRDGFMETGSTPKMTKEREMTWVFQQ